MKMNKLLAISSLTLATTLLAPAAFSAEKTLATVNGTAITQSMVDDYKRQYPGSAQQGGMNDERALDELIGRELVYQDAVNKKLEKDLKSKSRWSSCASRCCSTPPWKRPSAIARSPTTC